MKYLKLSTTIFFTLLAVEIYGEVIQSRALMWFTKPLLMPSLLLLFVLNATNHWFIERILFAMALIFSCMGDVFLLKDRRRLFGFGLVAFLLAHISYIILFIVQIQYDKNKTKRHDRMSTTVLSSIPFLCYIVLILYAIYPCLTSTSEESHNLLMPATIYTVVIVFMAYVSYLRCPTSSGYWSVFSGAGLFVISDSIIALDKFLVPFGMGRLIIMITYGIAQYLITIGIIIMRNKNVKYQ